MTNPQVEFRTFSFELSEVRAQGRRRLDEREIEGHANVFGVVDSFNSKFQKGAFSRSLRKKHMHGKTRVRFLFNHRSDHVLGVLTELKEDEKGLRFRAKFSDTARADEVLTLVKDEALTDVSIGFITRKQEIDEDKGILTKTEVELMDVSVVTFGSNEEALVEDFRSGDDPGQALVAKLTDEIKSLHEVVASQELRHEELEERLTAFGQTLQEEQEEEHEEEQEGSEEERSDHDEQQVDDNQTSSEDNQEQEANLTVARAQARARHGEAMTAVPFLQEV